MKNKPDDIIDLIDKKKSEVRELIKKTGIRKTAKLTGYDKGTLSKFVNGKRYMKIEDVIEVYEKIKGIK